MRGQPVHSRPATLHRASAALWQILFDRDRYDKSFAGSRRSRSPAPTVRHSLLLARFPTRFRTQHTLHHPSHTPSTPPAHIQHTPCPRSDDEPNSVRLRAGGTEGTHEYMERTFPSMGPQRG